MNTIQRWWLYQKYSFVKSLCDLGGFLKALLRDTLLILWNWLRLFVVVPFLMFLRLFVGPIQTIRQRHERELRVIDARVTILLEQLCTGKVTASPETLQAAGFRRQEQPPTDEELAKAGFVREQTKP